MKFMFILFAIFSQAAMALPVICESYEKTNGIASLRVKINPKVEVAQNGAFWSLYRLGITPPQGQLRQIMYSSGDLLPEKIHMTIINDGTVYGYIDLKSPEKNGSYEGKIRIGGILRGRIMDVRCTDERPQGDLI